MKYRELINLAMKLKNYSNYQLKIKLAEKGVHVDRSMISKLRTGRCVNTKDSFNYALAEVLGIDPDLLRVAAIKEKLPPDLIDLIKKIG